MAATFCVFLCVLSVPTFAISGSHSLWMLVTVIKGETPFPEFSATFMLDDIIVGHCNSEALRYFPRGNTTNEDEVLHHIIYSLRVDLHPFLMAKLSMENQTESPVVCQMMSFCEVWGNDSPGQMITKVAVRGLTTDEMRVFHSKFMYQGTAEVIKRYLGLSSWRHETIHYPNCLTALRNYLKNRAIHVKRKVKPRVRLIQKTNTYSGGSRVSCLATGFYPRHINLTLFRDGQAVADHEITGGDLLPNDDGTYQMRKSLEISAEEEREKHKYTCSAKHLSLDNKLDVTLEYDQGEPSKSVMFSVLMVLLLVLVFGTGAALIIWRRRHKGVLASK